MSGKKILHISLMGLILPIFQIQAQLTEDFSDGDFTSNPLWNGDVSNFIVNGAMELQLNAPAVTDTSYLVTETGILDFTNTVTWEFRMNLLFSPSSNNTGRFYLCSNQENLKGSLDGYYIRIGESGSVDKIKLYRQDGTSSALIATGIYGAYGVSPDARIRVTRDLAGNWLVEADSLGGTNFIFEAGATDTDHTFSKYSGVWCKYTTSNSGNFIYDDISIVGNVIVDNDPPAVVSANVSGANLIDITFNESVSVTAEDINNYVLPGDGNPLIVTNNNNVFELMFNTPFSAGATLSLEISNIEDLSSNILNDTIDIIVPDTALLGEVVVNEILFDPFTGGSDYVELYNNSTKSLDLYNYMIANFDDGVDNHKEIPINYILIPGEYVLLTEDSASTAAAYNYRNTAVFIEMDLPTFNNDSATVYVLNPDSLILDQFSYNDDMHFELINNVEGVSLERIDQNTATNNAFNWHSAAEAVGWGTPGMENSQNYSAGSSGMFFTVETPVFSPDNDGHEDVGVFSYTMENAGNVANLFIYDHHGRIVKQLLKNELLGTDGTVSWDGVINTGEKGRAGIYIVYFEVFDLQGNISAEKKTITLTTRL